MVKLHLGCGKRDFGPDWVHIDQADFPHISHKDVTQLPFGDSEVDLIYCSHLIAYFDREQIKPILKEWYRVLKRKGVLRISTPNWGVLRLLKDPMLGPLYGKMSEPPIYHKTVYDLPGLRTILIDAGFKNVKRYEHTKTEHAAFDDHSAAYFNDILISLNIECHV